MSRAHDRRDLSRRRFLQAGGALAGMVALGGIPGPRRSWARGALFSLGVASGDPDGDSVVLWTRLAPDPLNGGGLTDARVRVAWEVADDEAFGRIVRRGTAVARATEGHTVHAVATGLRPDRWYWYRFRAEGEESRIGRTRTLPGRSALPDRMRFALASCQDYQNGFYAAYHDINQQDLDLIVHVGDYIYEYAADPGAVRQHDDGEIQTLAQYRNRHALYRLDPDLQDAHAAFPFVCTWDDHEVADNYAKDKSAHGQTDAELLARRANAYQAYYEAMPLRRAQRPRRSGLNLYRRLHWGRLADLHVVDTRQYRSDQPCGDLFGFACPEVYDPEATMFGSRQERWLFDGLGRSKAVWNVLAQQVMMMQADFRFAIPGTEQPFVNFDAWDGYQVARRRLLEFLARRRPANPVVLTGDIHSAWAADLKPDFTDPASPVVGSELVCTSITSSFVPSLVPLIERALSGNPHIKLFDGRTHGYVRCEVTPTRWLADFRAVESILSPTAPARTLRSFALEAGTPGLQPA